MRKDAAMWKQEQEIKVTVRQYSSLDQEEGQREGASSAQQQVYLIEVDFSFYDLRTRDKLLSRINLSAKELVLKPFICTQFGSPLCVDSVAWFLCMPMEKKMKKMTTMTGADILIVSFNLCIDW